MTTDWAIDRIRNADPEELIRAIARAKRKGDGAHNPKPYATEWWAAGPLLEELRNVKAPNFGAVNEILVNAVCWRQQMFTPVSVAPLDIARAWLLAYERGLLEVGDE